MAIKSLLETFPETTVDTWPGITNPVGVTYRAQGFAVVRPARVYEVRLWCKKVGSPTDNVIAELTGRAKTGVSTGVVLPNGTSGAVAASGIGTSGEWVTFSFPAGPYVRDAACITLHRSGAADSSNNIAWGSDNSSATYPKGILSYYDGAWQARATYDHAFEVYGQYVYTSVSKAIVTIHAENWPRRMLAELPEASEIDRVYPLSGKGRFAFTIPNTAASANRDTLREGRIVAIWSTSNLPSYVGRIETLDEDPDRRTLEVSGDNLAAILYERSLPLDATFDSQAAGSIAMQLLRLANASNPTGIWPFAESAPGTPIRGTFDASGSSLGNALDDLASLTGDEWWLEEVVSRKSIEVYLRWGQRGIDKSFSVHLEEGVHITDARYTRDALGTAQAVRVIGGGATVVDRPAVVVATQGESGYAERASVIGSASEAHIRQRPVSPTLAREETIFLPLDTDEGMLADAAAKALQEPLTEAEAFELTVNNRISWRELAPGDTVRAILHSAYFEGVSRRVRILAMQPAEDLGTMQLDVEEARSVELAAT